MSNICSGKGYFQGEIIWDEDGCAWISVADEHGPSGWCDEITQLKRDRDHLAACVENLKEHNRRINEDLGRAERDAEEMRAVIVALRETIQSRFDEETADAIFREAAARGTAKIIAAEIAEGRFGKKRD